MKKSCMFFASDYHFEMISLPFINKNLSENKNVIILTENNLNSSINKVLAMINLKEDEKEKIRKIDWNNNKNIEKIENKKETIIFIKGNEEYIRNINKNIKTKENLNIVDCYDINEVQEHISDIASNYDNILSTSGVEKLL